MSDLLWSFDQLARFTKFEDLEVRCWAADRLVSLHPNEAPDAIAPLILDDHEATPELVAEHLGTHGGPQHIPPLLRGFKAGSGIVPGRCIEALARLGYEAAPALAQTAMHQRDIPEACLGIMVSALARVGKAGSGLAADQARELLLRRPELFAEPAALRGAIGLLAPEDFGELILKWITALHFKGLGEIEPCIRVLLEELQLEDSGWCVRTDRSGRIDLDRTLKAIESGYDLDVRSLIPPVAVAEISDRLKEGSFPEIAQSFGAYIRSRASAQSSAAVTDTLPTRLDALGRAFLDPAVLKMADRMEPAMHQWLIGILISAAVKVSSYRNYLLDIEAAGQSLDALLGLAGAETSCLLNTLPVKLAAAAEAGATTDRAHLRDWCLRTLEARGPFFPKALALDALGCLQAADLLPEISPHLADDSPYIYGAAERALARIGGPVIDHTRTLIRRGGVHPDALQSLVRVCCDLSRDESLRLVLDHFDDIFEAIGPEAASEAVGILGRRELLPHLRRWLDRSPALVGHALLLAGAINGVPIPEEPSILKAIDDFWKGATEGADGSAGPSGQYLM